MRGPSTRPGEDGVDADAVYAELDGKGSGEADDAPFRGAVGAAQGEAEFSGGGAEVDDAAAACGAEQRGGASGAMEHAGEIGLEDGVQLLGGDVFGELGGPGDAGVVDQHVHAAEMVGGGLHEAVQLGRLASVGPHALVAAGGKGGVVDVADERVRAACGEAVGHDAADAAGAGGYRDPEAGEVERNRGCCGEGHWCVPMLSRQRGMDGGGRASRVAGSRGRVSRVAESRDRVYASWV